jgi:hypothetical protein
VKPAAAQAVRAAATVDPTRFGTVTQVGGGVGAGVGTGVGAGVGTGVGCGVGAVVGRVVGAAVTGGLGVVRGVEPGVSVWSGRAVGSAVIVTGADGACVPGTTPGSFEIDGAAVTPASLPIGEDEGADDADAPATMIGVAVAVVSLTPLTDWNPPPSVKARTAIASTATRAASDGRRPGSGMAASMRPAMGAATGAAKTCPQDGQSPSDFSQQNRQA